MSDICISAFQSENCTYNHRYHKQAPEISPHSHDVCEVIFLIKGSADYIVDGKHFPLTRNCLAISRPGEIHAINLPENSEYERYDMLFDEKMLHSDIYTLLSADMPVIDFEGNELVAELFRKADYYCEHFKGDTLQCILLHLMEEVFYNVALASRESMPETRYFISPLINQAVTYIEKHLTEPLDIETLCRELYVTKSHLHQLFQKHLQVSPHKYILSKRLNLAQRRLRHGEKSTEVCIACGFTDYSTFYKNYKQYFGYAPSDEPNHKAVRTIQS